MTTGRDTGIVALMSNQEAANGCQHDIAKSNHTLYIYEPGLRGYCGMCDMEFDKEKLLEWCSNLALLPWLLP